MKTAIVALALFAIAGPCLAQEPVGCDKFKWPLDKEHAMLTDPKLPTVASGGNVAQPIPAAITVDLVPFADAKLPMAPERQPKSPGSFAGFVQVAAPTQAGTYKITLSAGGWIDVIQAGRTVKSSAFSGATGCDGMRKSVKFDLAAQPFSVELSGMSGNTIKMAITGD